MKYSRNYVGTLMFIVFLMSTTIKIISRSVRSLWVLKEWRWWYELCAVTPVSTLLLGVMFWMLFDPSWLNLDDEEKESRWLTWRWVKFSPLLLMLGLPLGELLSEPWKGETIVAYTLDSIIYFFAYISLCVSHDRGFGRLFQPYAVVRTKEYIDAKGQKFETNIIGTTMNIIILGVPNWLFILRQPASHLIDRALEGFKDTASYVTEVTADSVVLVMVLYVLAVMFLACVKVTFYLAQSRWNYLKFSPVITTPILVIISKWAFHSADQTTWDEKLGLCAYALIGVIAYFSLISPPDSLMAVFFQPYVPLLNTVADLPEVTVKPHVKSNVVLEDSAVDTKQQQQHA